MSKGIFIRLACCVASVFAMAPVLADEGGKPPESVAQATPRASPARIVTAATERQPLVPLVKLGTGDLVVVQVYGKPDLGTTTTVAEDGTVLVPLAGAVKVIGLSPAQASERIAEAYKRGEFLVNPQVTLTISNGKSQQVSVLGAVGKPGRYPIESRNTVFDLLADAGGKLTDGASVIVLMHTDGSGRTTRTSIDLDSLTDPKSPLPDLRIEGGDTLFVPRASQFFVYGEVNAPNQYRLEPGMTVIQALTRAGGITRRGSSSRIEIRRRSADGEFTTLRPKLNDSVQADDVIRVRESIF